MSEPKTIQDLLAYLKERQKICEGQLNKTDSNKVDEVLNTLSFSEGILILTSVATATVSESFKLLIDLVEREYV